LEHTVKARVGQTLVSTVDGTAVVVVRAPAGEVALTCGGADMVDSKAVPIGAGHGATTTLDPAQAGGALLGKRYADDALGLELLCTKGGQGTLAVGGAPLALKDAKPLPATD
jgi:hypothetical protein